MSNSLEPDQARRIVGPDMVSNCLQRATVTGKEFKLHLRLIIHVKL